MREHLNRNNILAVKQSSSEQRLNQSTWTEVEPLQRARPRNDLSQRRGISGYIWSADSDSGFQAAVILEEEEGARGTNCQVNLEVSFEKINPRTGEACIIQSNCIQSNPNYTRQ